MQQDSSSRCLPNSPKRTVGSYYSPPEPLDYSSPHQGRGRCVGTGAWCSWRAQLWRPSRPTDAFRPAVPWAIAKGRGTLCPPLTTAFATTGTGREILEKAAARAAMAATARATASASGRTQKNSPDIANAILIGVALTAPAHPPRQTPATKSPAATASALRLAPKAQPKHTGVIVILAGLLTKAMDSVTLTSAPPTSAAITAHASTTMTELSATAMTAILALTVRRHRPQPTHARAGSGRAGNVVLTAIARKILRLETHIARARMDSQGQTVM